MVGSTDVFCLRRLGYNRVIQIVVVRIRNDFDGFVLVFYF